MFLELIVRHLSVGTLQNDAFSSTSTFLSGTFQRMNRMARRQGGQWYYLMLFLLLVLWIFVILWIKRR